MTSLLRIAGLAAVLPALLGAGSALARQSPDAPAHGEELGYCRAHVVQLAPPDARVPDPEAFCACYADGAVKARLWELEKAEANVGEEVRQPVAERTIALHDAKAAQVAAACLKP
jgi:hypothetical protein